MRQRSTWATARSLSLLALCGAVTLAGCGEDEGRLSIASRGAPGAAAQAAAAPKAAEAKAAEPEEDSETQYEHEESSQFRDPFRSFLREFQRKAEGPVDEDTPRSPTELYDVGQYKLVGVITGTPVPKAMVVDPTGYGHMIRPGDRIGKQGGRVAAIYGNEVVVRTPNPRMGDEESSLHLYPPGQEQKSYELNVVEAAKAPGAKSTDEERFLQQLDLQRILAASAAARQRAAAESGAGAATAGDTPQANIPQDLPAIPIVPILPGMMMQPPPSGGGASGSDGNNVGGGQP